MVGIIRLLSTTEQLSILAFQSPIRIDTSLLWWLVHYFIDAIITIPGRRLSHMYDILAY
jgi:hypothetical protein